MPKRQRPTVGNVIYANFGARTKVTVPEESAAPARAERRTNLASQLLIDAVSSEVDSGRLKRGKAYAKNGNVVNVDFINGRMIADVAGSQNVPFNVNVVLPPRQTDQLSTVTEYLLNKQGFRDAREGKIDQTVAQMLVCEPDEQVRFLCDCPDPAVVCKHCVAVVFKATEKMDADPSLVFALRGMDFAMIEKALQQQASQFAEKWGAEDGAGFWGGKPLPPLPDPVVASALEESDIDALHKAMRSISYTAVDELRAVSDIEEMYDYLTSD